MSSYFERLVQQKAEKERIGRQEPPNHLPSQPAGKLYTWKAGTNGNVGTPKLCADGQELIAQTLSLGSALKGVFKESLRGGPHDGSS
ncbi:hypothetical protein CYMTET_19585 [Cymbomonas tetramitiformis]|uniref:Uncharacterized protein n=1 Tax=Cymbomonas tetramitiformis TaxID=36881 RepID=A0AAE0G5R4_9CHLO|nr:hypothetical protein CYMTET_19585 [Cymbomonas tetramitiformis]